jgi:hypothetical protein
MARTQSSKNRSGKKTTEPKEKQNNTRPRKTAKTSSGDSVEEVIPIGYDNGGPTSELSAGLTARLAMDESEGDEIGNLSGGMETQSGESEEGQLHRRIAERAFNLYLEGGCRHGNDLEHWFEAEREIRRQEA